MKKNEKKGSDKSTKHKRYPLLLSLILAFILPLFTSAETTNIVMVDVSGSMAGYGYRGKNVFPKIKRELNNFVTMAKSKGQKTKIIQFASNIHENNGSKLVIRRGNTNLYKALLYSQKQIRTGRNNIFFITDGAHNMQPSLNDLCTELRKIKQQPKDSVYYYYVAFNESSKQSDMARLFDGKDNFVLLDSLYVPDNGEAKTTAQQHTSKVNSVKDVVANKKDIPCIWAYILVLFIVCLAFILWYLLPYILSVVPNLLRSVAKFNCFNGIVDKTLKIIGRSSQGFETFMNQPIKDKMQQIQRLTNMIYRYPANICQKELYKLNPKMRDLVENVHNMQTGNLPSSSDKGSWSGERGNSTFTLSDDYEWGNRYGDRMTVREWRKKYKISEPIKVEYKNGEPIYDPYSIAETKVPYKECYNYKDIKELHDPVNNNLKRELDPSLLNQSAADPVRDYIENTANDGSRNQGCRNTYHEKRDGETIQIVPDFIHKICTHNGGRSLASLVQKKL